MCQWRQWLANNFVIRLLCNIISHRCVFHSRVNVESPFSWSVHNGESECSVWHWSITWHRPASQRPICPSCSLPVYVSFPHQALHHFQGWERRLRLSFCLTIASFQKTDKGEKSTDPRFSIGQKICPSIQASIHLWDWVSVHTVNPKQRSCLSTAASHILLVRHSSTALSFKVRVPLPVRFFFSALTTLDL